MPLMTDLITSRLVLHRLTVAEAARLVAGAAGPGDLWADGFPGQGDRDAARMLVKAAKERAETGEPTESPALPGADPFTSYRIDCRADGKAIGTIGFHGPPDVKHQATIGYGLVPQCWGNGYATEALHALIEFCRARPDVRSLAADTNHDNAASQRVLIKSGFRLVNRDRELLYYELELGA
jgi:RimJ/RimL family protein N-acetyltransferase